MLHRLALMSVLLSVGNASIVAQRIEVVDEADLPRFEVASVKPADPTATRSMVGIPPGRYVQEDADMFFALNVAFGVGFHQMPDRLPGALAERCSIHARMPAGATPRDRALMVRALLVDRFKLRYHVETKEQDGYALTVARRDGRLGPNMRQSSVDCTARLAAQSRNETVAPLAQGAKECGIRNGPAAIDFGGMSLSLLVQMLSNQTGRQVVDQTGLTGNFDVELLWSRASSGPLRATPDPAPPASDGPSIFTAVEEQLGLRLQSVKVPVDYLVIDHVERPQPD
jgi:uncharacterized protein (TIGR03435 family)